MINRYMEHTCYMYFGYVMYFTIIPSSSLTEYIEKTLLNHILYYMQTINFSAPYSYISAVAGIIAFNTLDSR